MRAGCYIALGEGSPLREARSDSSCSENDTWPEMHLIATGFPAAASTGHIITFLQRNERTHIPLIRSISEMEHGNVRTLSVIIKYWTFAAADDYRSWYWIVLNRLSDLIGAGFNRFI